MNMRTISLATHNCQQFDTNTDVLGFGYHHYLGRCAKAALVKSGEKWTCYHCLDAEGKKRHLKRKKELESAASQG